MKNLTRCGAPISADAAVGCPYPLIDKLDGRGKRCAVYGFAPHTVTAPAAPRPVPPVAAQRQGDRPMNQDQIQHVDVGRFGAELVGRPRGLR